MNAVRSKKTGSKESPHNLAQTSPVMPSLRDEFAMSDGGEDPGVCWGHRMW